MHNIKDFPVVAAAINAGTSCGLIILSTEVENRMVEEVEHIHAELGNNALGDPKILRHSSVIGKTSWSAE